VFESKALREVFVSKDEEVLKWQLAYFFTSSAKYLILWPPSVVEIQGKYAPLFN
jgi:hypothetical protein